MNSIHALLLGFACGFALSSAILFSLRRKTDHVESATYRNGFIKGLGLGAKNHADWITRHHGIPANGFVFVCPECSNIQEIIINADQEWCNCYRCGHRMGAPLCEVRKEFQF